MILVNNPGSWSFIYDPLEHAKWHGLTPTDLVFPFFLFAVGNALSFVLPKMEAAGDMAFWKKVVKRTVLIFLIGLFLNWNPFFMWQNDQLVVKSWTWVNSKGDLSGIRIFGVLQRIALCYFFASVIIYYFKLRNSFYAGIILLLTYWALCLAFGSASDPFSLENWFGTSVDLSVLGTAHVYKGEGVPFDPEGLMSTIPAIVQVIFGFITGDYIQKKGKTAEMLNGLFIAAVAFLITGYFWGQVFPINKKIWTSSYTVLTTGMAILTIATMIYFIEFKGSKGWLSRFFDVFGKNSLFVFALSGFLPRVLGLIRISNGFNDKGDPKYLSPFGWFYEYVCKPIPGSPELGSLVYAIIMILFYWAICFYLDKKQIYIKV